MIFKCLDFFKHIIIDTNVRLIDVPSWVPLV